MAGGNFSGGSFSGAVGGFSVDGGNVDRTTGGGGPAVRWGEWTTPFTPAREAEDIKAIIDKILGERRIEAERTTSAQAVEREIAARRQVEQARTRNDRKRATKAAREARLAREELFGKAYEAAFQAAFARYYEGERTRRLRRDEEDAIAIILMMH